LGNAQLRRRFREIQRLSHGNEVSQMAQFYSRVPSCQKSLKRQARQGCVDHDKGNSTKTPLRVHTMPVIGGRDMEAGAVSVRLHEGGPQGAKPKGEVIADILAGIKERRA